MTDHDAVNYPRHYTSHPSGVECIEVTRHMGFNLGNAMKYIWRADLKNDAIEDLEKARWYLDDEIAKRAKRDPLHGGRLPRRPAQESECSATEHSPQHPEKENQK